MTPHSQKKSAKSGKIAVAALTQFEQHGFQATSLEQIAVQAGIGKSTLYEYFRNKEELFIAAIQEGSGQWLDTMEQVCTEVEDPMERLNRVAEGILGLVQWSPYGNQRMFMEILIQTIMVGGVFYQRGELLRDLHQRVIRLITMILLEGVSRGSLRPEIACHAEKVAINFLAFLDGMKYYTLVAADYIDIRAQLGFFMEHLTPLLLKGNLRPDIIPGGSPHVSTVE